VKWAYLANSIGEKSVFGIAAKLLSYEA